MRVLLPLLLVAVMGGVIYFAWFMPSAAPVLGETPAPFSPTLHETSHFTASLTPAATPIARAPEPPKIPAAPAATRPSLSASQLMRQYLATNDTSARMEILHDIADDALAGVPAFVQLFPAETDETLKELMIDLAETVGEPSQDLFAFLGMALRGTQPDDVRAAAIRVLLLNGDVRAIPLWQTLLVDEDPDTRELAAEQIALLRAM